MPQTMITLPAASRAKVIPAIRATLFPGSFLRLIAFVRNCCSNIDAAFVLPNGPCAS
jgi:hypothetical protein